MALITCVKLSLLYYSYRDMTLIVEYSNNTTSLLSALKVSVIVLLGVYLRVKQACIPRYLNYKVLHNSKHGQKPREA